MKHIEKKKLSKNQLSALILSAVCVFILAVSIPISVFLLSREPEAAALANLLSPHTPPFQGLLSHILSTVHLL